MGLTVMETLKLSYEELVAEVEKLNATTSGKEEMCKALKIIFQNRSKELGVSSGAPVEHPQWFTPVVQGVVTELWLVNKPGENLRMAAVKYMQDEAFKTGEKLFISNAIDLIKSVLPDNKLN
jgi:hypothetical protein